MMVEMSEVVNISFKHVSLGGLLIAKNERVIIKKSLLTDGESVVETCTFIIPDTEDSDEGDWILSEFGGSIGDQGVPKVVSRKL